MNGQVRQMKGVALASEGCYVLKWFTPLEGIGGDIFRVERDGAELPYHGKLVKRGPPVSNREIS
jgi:hypothetical protein